MPIDFDSCADESTVITCWVPLMDATHEAGCMEVLPRVHNQGTLRHYNANVAGPGLAVHPDALPPALDTRMEVHMMNYALNTMNYAFKTMNSVFKTMNSAFKTMNSVGQPPGDYPRPLRHWRRLDHVPTPGNMYTLQKPQFAPDFGPKLCIYVPRSRYHMTPHGSSENTSGVIRWAADLRYNAPEAGDCKLQETLPQCDS